MNNKNHNILLWLTLFAISMGIFEGAVVVYLRALYYPSGFEFPLAIMDINIAVTELIREFASLIMLLSVAVIAGKNFSQRFAWFIYSFAVWDIVYYIFLYFILGWPESLFTWDILFLLPITWTGPVISPLIISGLMILLSLIIYKHNIKTDYTFKLIKKDWAILISGSVIVFISFTWDYCRFLVRNFSNTELKLKSFSNKLFDLSVQYIPERFPWVIFLTGVLILFLAIYFIWVRMKKNL